VQQEAQQLREALQQVQEEHERGQATLEVMEEQLRVERRQAAAAEQQSQVRGRVPLDAESSWCPADLLWPACSCLCFAYSRL
jgi:hypothetical protein